MQTVQLAFVLDATASMQDWIDTCKNEIRSLIRKTRLPGVEVEIALVDYTDYENDARIPACMVDFTTNVDHIHASLAAIRAEGGEDVAEDVAGALDTALMLSWKPIAIKHIVHLADAPPHGIKYHTPWVNDRYPNGDPLGLDLEEILQDIAGMNVTYTFFRITENTNMFIRCLEMIFKHNLVVVDLKEKEYTRQGVRTRVSNLDDHSFSGMVSQVIGMTLNPSSPGDEPVDPAS